MQGSTRTVAAIGLVTLVVGLLVWLFVGSGGLGGSLMVIGAVALVAAAVIRSPRDDEPEAQLHNERADQQRLDEETDAMTENVEERPPPTGG